MEYQYDEPSEEFDDAESEEVLLTNNRYKIVTEPLHVQAEAGDRIFLPCKADEKLGELYTLNNTTIILSVPESVEVIWERPDAKQIVSIGDKLIRDDNLEEFSIEATEIGNTLIIEASTKEHEGQYMCQLATKNSVGVTHSVTINLQKPKHQPLESGGSCFISTIMPLMLWFRLFL